MTSPSARSRLGPSQIPPAPAGICLFHCGATFHRSTGSAVHVSYEKLSKLANKHNVRNKAVIAGAIFSMRFVRFVRSNLTHNGTHLIYSNYDPTAWEYEVVDGTPRRTGRHVSFLISVNWADGRPRSGNLVTMYCPHSLGDKCPEWINNTAYHGT